MAEPTFPDLRAFMAQLRRDHQLVVVDAPVDRHLEVAEIHRRVIAAGGPALLFTQVKDADFPLVTNLFGTARRAELAFGKRPLRLIQRLVEAAQTLLPPSPSKLWRARDLAAAALRLGTKRREKGPVTEIVTPDVRLDRLPALTCWSQDGGPFLTLPLVYTEHPDVLANGGSASRSLGAPSASPFHVGRSNLGLYRMQVHGASTTGMHWQIGKGAGFLHRGRPAGPVAGDDVSRRAAGAHPFGDRTLPRACPSCCSRR